MNNNHYVAFIDILGYSNLVENYFKESKKESLLKKIEIIIDEAYKLDNLMLKKLNSDILFVSDSLIITIKEDRKDLHELDMLFAFLSYFQAKCLYEGIYVRGAVSKGDHYSKKNANYQILISKALIKSVAIEKNQAIYPRIIVDNILIREITNKKNKSNFVFINTENTDHFIDVFLGIVTWHHYYGKRESLVEILTKITNDILLKIEENITNNKVLEKYKWLLDYLAWRTKDLKETDDIFFYERNHSTQRNFQLLTKK
ncbi:hypothetical protein [Leptospira kanakyensis]|uniref:hypothetical protein n=1 Tax=Leptospira kanakyensis TaxID=2484968 RepID=UPI00223D3DFE|nr:hypothetical protein [Leptospira kanakyensis]MCW7483236.1 hypothetical protein [Leptospira kanakyensis]